MQLKMYSIRDSKTEIFNNPFFNHSHGEAERNFRDLVNDEKSMLFKYPEDYDLYYMGEYETTTGKISPIDSPAHMMKAVNLVKNTAPISLKTQ